MAKIERWLVGPESELKWIEGVAQDFIDGRVYDKVARHLHSMADHESFDLIERAKWYARREYSSKTDKNPISFRLLPVDTSFYDQQHKSSFTKESDNSYLCDWGACSGKTFDAKPSTPCYRVCYPTIESLVNKDCADNALPYVDLIESERPILKAWDDEFKQKYGVTP